MKKILYGTTALVAVGLTAGAANAAEKIKIGVSGYAQYFLTYTDQDGNGNAPLAVTNFNNNHPQSLNGPVDVKHNGEIWFKGSTKLDNGITVGVDVQLESFNSGDNIDEQYMFISSPTLGKLIIGDENGAAYLLHIWTLGAGVHIDTGTVGSVSIFTNTSGGSLFNSPLGTTNGRALDNDGAKITYLSPRIMGLQAGVSFSPRFTQDSTLFNTGGRVSSHDGWDVALQYKTKFDEVGFGAMVGGKWADASNTLAVSPDASVKLWKANGELTYAGFRLSGGWLKQTSGLIAANNSIKGSSGIVGLTYNAGPWGAGITYFTGNTEDLVTTAGSDELDKGILEGRYTLGPGINLVGGIFAYDLDAEGTTAQEQANGEGSNDGWGALVGVKMSF